MAHIGEKSAFCKVGMTMFFPKPEKPIRGTVACRNHMGLVAQLPCVCCGISPVQVHHCIHGRHAQRRSSDFDTIPLCSAHHRQAADGLHVMGRKAWERHHGVTELELLDDTRKALEATA